jgi:hypothetical protein
LLDEVDVAARNTLEDGARVRALATAGGMRAAIVAEIVLEILIARKGLRDLEHGIEPRSLEDAAAALPVLTAQRTDASTRPLDEVHVAAREFLRDGAGALTVGPAVVGASLAAHAQSERGDGARHRDTDDPRIEQLRELQDGLPGSTCDGSTGDERSRR